MLFYIQINNKQHHGTLNKLTDRQTNHDDDDDGDNYDVQRTNSLSIHINVSVMPFHPYNVVFTSYLDCSTCLFIP